MTEPATLLLSNEEQESVLRAKRILDDRHIKRLKARMVAVATDCDAGARASLLASFEAETQSYLDQILRTRSVAELTCKAEVQLYEAMSSDIQDKCKATEERIEELKRELKEVQQERANRLEYDVLAREIREFATRAELNDLSAKIQDSLKPLRAASDKYEEIASTSRDRFAESLDGLTRLHAYMSEQVGVLERNEVEREGEGDEEPAEASESKAQITSSLNPRAPPFRPGALAASAEGNASSGATEYEEGEEPAEGRRRTRSDSVAVNEEEDGEVASLARGSAASTKRKASSSLAPDGAEAGATLKRTRVLNVADAGEGKEEGESSETEEGSINVQAAPAKRR